MKHIFVFLLCALFVLPLSAQEEFFHAEKTTEMQRPDASLAGRAGMQVISPHSDLVITVEQPEVDLKVNGPQVLNDGRYIYKTTVDISKRSDVKFKFQRKGKALTAELTKKSWKHNYQYSCVVAEIENPITMQEQTGKNRVSDKNDKLLIEFTTSMEGFAIELSPELQFTKETKSVEGNGTLKRYCVYIDYPHFKQLKDTYSCSDPEKWEQICTITISAKNSNSLTLPVEDIKNLSKEERKSYAILSMKEKEHVSDANAKVEEGGRLFGLRKYVEAKAAYKAALLSSDILASDRNRVNRLIQQCDSCSYYTKLVNGAYKEMKAQQTMDQQAAANYAEIAIQAMNHLYQLNPSSFYETKIKELKSFVGNMPLSMRFTVVKWVKSAAGMEEGGAMPNVELWAHYSDGSLVKLGTTDGSGIIDVDLDRNKLPSLVDFRPIGYSKKTKSASYSMSDIMSKSTTEHLKTQIRIQIFCK